MNRFLARALFFFLLTVFFFSCSEDDGPSSQGEFESGVIVINEGNFTEGDASLSFYSASGNAPELNVFEAVNGRKLGDVAQSGYIYDTLLYIVVNNSNKVEVLNRYSLKSAYTIDALLPRYMTLAKRKVVLTEWVSFTEPGRLSFIDIASGQVEGSVTVGAGAEFVKVIGDLAYVSNTFENTISVVNIDSRLVTETITLPTAGPNQMDIVNGNLWVACKGTFNANDGAIHRINLSTNEIEETIAINANISGKLAFNFAGDKFYYYVENNVFMKDVNSSAISTEPFIIGDDFTSLYGITVDHLTDEIYLADSKNFLEDGEVYHYSEDGDLIKSFTVGRG
ncbi:MAG: DUF5074 domain-containing protein, partial [Bacteroidota bacterium]